MQSGPDGFVMLSEASILTGIGRAALRRRVRAGDLPVFVDGRDVRRKLVKVVDLHRLSEIRPAKVSQGVATGSSAAT
jgi:hypothetical protein